MPASLPLIAVLRGRHYKKEREDWFLGHLGLPAAVAKEQVISGNRFQEYSDWVLIQRSGFLRPVQERLNERVVTL